MSAERKNSTIIDGKPVSRRELLKAGLMTAAAVSPLAALAQQVQGGANSNPNHRIIEAERPIAGKAVGLEKGGAEVKAMNAILLSDVNIPGKGKMNFVQALTSEVYNPILKAAQEKFFAEIKANPTSKAAVEYDKNYAASVRAANEMGVEPPKKYSIVQLPN